MNSNASCQFFTRGLCRYGENCRYMHRDESLDSETAGKNKVSENKNTVVQSETNQPESHSSKQCEPSNWVMAPVFIPKSQQAMNYNTFENNNPDKPQVEGVKSYADVVMGDSRPKIDGISGYMCPYGIECPFITMCLMLHPELCDMCGIYCLHPTDKSQRKWHTKKCIEQHERNMELSFAVARSKDKTCGVCFDVIVEKIGREKRFGILPNCNHVFCLACIRKWRQAKHFDNKITRSCPLCRTPSDYICPSAFWVETKEEKSKLLDEYKLALGEKDCKYFKKGAGKCPFGNKCFYKHALENGERIDVGAPRRRKAQRVEEEILDLIDVYLWDFFDNRESGWLQDIMFDTSEEEDSPWDD